MFSNVIDPFSALFDSLCQGIILKEWIEKEKSRQLQKTLQNALGDFHQELLGAMAGWKSLGRGHVFDLINEEKQIIAEVKNKYNTTKGNHKVVIYDDLAKQIKNSYKGYTAYYVEIIPKNRQVYDKLFTPSDNRTQKRRPKNKNIRVIDGQSFYALATGEKSALKRIYETLPMIIGDILDRPHSNVETDKTFLELFDRAYNTNST